MDATTITKKFEQMGARAAVRAGTSFRIDIRRDNARHGKGSLFDIQLPTDNGTEVAVLDIDPADRHLLLMTKDEIGQGRFRKSKFLAGHDERDWFVAGVDSKVSSVKAAKASLQPFAVTQALNDSNVRPKDRLKRKNEVYTRQGEWFFVPQPGFEPKANLILKNEPVRRGRSKPHICEFIYREGGQAVRVSSQYPNGVTEGEYRKLVRDNPGLGRLNWRTMVRDARVYAKGRITHPDHATIVLDTWCRVLPNSESQQDATRNGMAFLD